MSTSSSSPDRSIPDAAFLLALTRIPGVGNKTLLHLLHTYGSGQSLWQALEDPENTLAGIRPHIAAALRAHRSAQKPAVLWETARAEHPDIDLIGYTDERFPTLLREIPDAPLLLYVRGQLSSSAPGPLITIIGTRRPSTYGQQVVQDFAMRLSQAGFTIVSGLAFGIDSLAHQATLQQHGHTVAVIGSGVDDTSIAPQSHLKLAHQMLEQGGAILSEYAPGTQATPHSFPARNRIMAGMSSATLVIEAGERSGTLITARLALDYGRDVLAIPGSLFTPQAIGCHRLIQQGAKLITSLEDILTEFPALSPVTVMTPSSNDASLSEDERVLLSLLTHEPLHIDRIIQQSRRSTSEVMADLTLLEMKGLAKNIGGMHYMNITHP